MSLSLPALWIFIGILLCLSEFIIPGFIIMFFGIGSILTGCIVFCFGDLAFWIQIVSFLSFSVLSLALFRKYLFSGNSGEKKADRNTNYDEDVIGRTVQVIEPIVPGEMGKIELDGTNWNAVSEASHQPGDWVKITGRKGLTVIVK